MATPAFAAGYTMTDLGSLGFGTTFPTAITDDNGQIVVQGYSNTTGQNHAFLLAPN